MSTTQNPTPETELKSDKKAPGFWFYTADYERDMQILSLSAQGLWARMLCWMSDNEAHRGFLELPTGDPMTKWDIASKVGKTVRETEKALDEMKRVGIYSVDERSCIFSRRMARENHISEVRALAAKSRADKARRAANGSFAGDFAGAKQPAKEQQTPTVPVPVPVSASTNTLLSADADVQAPAVVAGKQPIPFPEPPKSPTPKWFDEQHERFYRSFWNRVNRKGSRKAFEKRWRQLWGTSKFTEWTDVVQFLINQIAIDRARFEHTKDWDWRANLHPATWLNGERWEDESNAKARDSPAQTKEIDYPLWKNEPSHRSAD